MLTRLALSTLIGMAFVSHAAAVTRNVPADYPTIQAALNASTSGDIVLVAPGTYAESLVMGPPMDGVTLQSASGPELTTIDGQNLHRVITCSGLGPQTAIVGFTIANGRAIGAPNNVGGGLNLLEAHLRIEGNIIRDNLAEAAGGLYVNFSSPTLRGNVIRDNEALATGGGIYCDHFSDPVIESNIIARNTAGHFGGGITAWETSSPRVLSNTIVSNTAVMGGGGIYITRRCSSEIRRNIIAHNNQGGGITRNDEVTSPSLGCNDVWSNTPANYSGLPDVTGSDGNISIDPLFCNFLNLDLRLDETSPCTADNSPAGCELIGALDVGCGVTPVTAGTWGGVKARFHPIEDP